MHNVIAIVGVDNAGKSTLIEKTVRLYNIKTAHQNYFIKHIYPHRKSYIWECLNLVEVTVRNIYWRFFCSYKYLLLDRCYICGLVYSNIEGVPHIAHQMTKWAIKPDMICLIEPVEELVPNAYKFTREYKIVLRSEGYRQIKRGFHEFGRTTFWVKGDYPSQVLSQFIQILGSA